MLKDAEHPEHAWCQDYLQTGGASGSDGSCCKADGAIYNGWCKQARGTGLDRVDKRETAAAAAYRPGRDVGPPPCCPEISSAPAARATVAGQVARMCATPCLPSASSEC